MNRRSLELLSPAANAETAIQAVKHGADAVYIGPPSHGARKSASNSIEDIERVVDFAHTYRAKVYATVNTIVYENEISKVEALCRDLYHAGVDALIVQDMGILRMKIPPIALHASTQCDIRTPQKARFLQEVGFSQLVLARELTLEEIKAIASEVTIPLESFVHGALCVSYSGRCHASLALTGRSANRGECAQICRLPYSLVDSSGKVISKDKYLLSLKDFNSSRNIPDLIKAGISSFKIEGRLKDIGYVKNITALYNIRLNDFIASHPDEYQRSSYGHVDLNFKPQADKSFNRGFTNYFLTETKPLKIASLESPKSQGEPIRKISDLNNGDGISFYDSKGEFTGVMVNRVEKGRIVPARNVKIPAGSQIFRTSDVKWDKILNSETSRRKIDLDLRITNNSISAKDSRGVEVAILNDKPYEAAKKPIDFEGYFSKLGNTPYNLRSLKVEADPARFYRASDLSDLKRQIVTLLDKANKATYPFSYRRKENVETMYPYKSLDFKDNVANSLARDFYLQHGVTQIQPAAEVKGRPEKGDVVMTTRHCILRELGLCRKIKGKADNLRFPLKLNFDGGQFNLDFDCKACEMKVIYV